MHLNGEAATLEAAATLAPHLRPGDVLGLIGSLGAGKTCFVKGLAHGLGIAVERVASPTFTIVHEYRGGRLTLHHIDLYRIENPRELDELGLEELVGSEGVCAIEWADRFPRVMATEWLELAFDFAGETGRTIVARGTGARGKELARRWNTIQPIPNL